MYEVMAARENITLYLRLQKIKNRKEPTYVFVLWWKCVIV
jgi:hypothetical protein